jgi:hypothetical protein
LFSTRALKQKVMPGGTGGIDSPGPAAYRECGKSEVSTVQVDPFLQASAFGGDAFNGSVATGIQLSTVGALNGRILCLLARAKFNQGRRVRLVGVRQYLSIGSPQTNGTPAATTTVAKDAAGTTLPIVAGTLDVASTAGFPASGSFIIDTVTGPQTFTYSGNHNPTFDGVNGGLPGGVLFGGEVVTSTAFAAGSEYTSYFERQVTSPRWRFPDGNVSWHVMAMQPNTPTPAFLVLPGGVTGNVTNQPPGSAFALANTPSILALSSAADAGYTPPNGGRPFGNPLTPDLGNFHDLRFPWDSANAWHYSVDVPINAPCDIALFASVAQTDPEGRNNPTPPASPILSAPSAGVSTLSPEDQFYLTFVETAVYWRIAGALVFAENCGEDNTRNGDR